MRIIALIMTLGLMACQQASTQPNPTTFTLRSANLEGQATNKEVFTDCGGENVSPQLSWVNAPEGTKSFAVTVYDPDAPTGSGWWHWLVVNIPAETSELPQGAGAEAGTQLPKGVIQTITDYGKAGYGGPCPPEGHGFHQYIVTVYALKTDRINVKPTTNPAVVGYQINANTLAKASLVFYHKR